MVKNVSIIGSTGSIGTQTLDVARNLGIKVWSLAANSNIDLLEKQVREFMPVIVSVGNDELADQLASRLKGFDTKIYCGIDGIKKAAVVPEAELVVTSVVGVAGLIPTLEAIRAGKSIALANKETLVTAGSIVMDEAKNAGISIIPVDSEHSAIFQCLAGNRGEDVSRLILTASGGPFRGRKVAELANVTKAQALKHPNWTMGSKITIDSATLMNKGLEVIEARWLFGVGAHQIDVVVHPQSIIHSMVEYADGSVMAQMGSPDMRIPIQLALTYPERRKNNFPKLDLLNTANLTFEKPDLETFSCLRLAYEALRAGGTLPAAMNAANEVAVGLFLDEKIGFMDIPRIIEKVMAKHTVNISPTLDDIIEVDRWGRETAMER